jgi:hypothetical protein
MRLGHQTVIVLSSSPTDSDHHCWAVSDRKYRTEKKHQEIWLDENWKIFGFAGWLALACTERFQMGWF